MDFEHALASCRTGTTCFVALFSLLGAELLCKWARQTMQYSLCVHHDKRGLMISANNTQHYVKINNYTPLCHNIVSIVTRSYLLRLKGLGMRLLPRKIYQSCTLYYFYSCMVSHAQLYSIWHCESLAMDDQLAIICDIVSLCKLEK